MESRAANTFSCGMLREASDPPPSPSPLLPNTPQPPAQLLGQGGLRFSLPASCQSPSGLGEPRGCCPWDGDLQHLSYSFVTDVHDWGWRTGTRHTDVPWDAVEAPKPLGAWPHPIRVTTAMGLYL